MYIAIALLGALWMTALGVVTVAGKDASLAVAQALASDEQLVADDADWAAFDEVRTGWATEDVRASRAA